MKGKEMYFPKPYVILGPYKLLSAKGGWAVPGRWIATTEQLQKRAKKMGWRFEIVSDSENNK